MCGILGTVNQPFEESALNLLAHRGPDDSGIALTAAGSHLVTLGQRRLSILDLSPAGHQPMWLGGRQRGIVFNGEIYNHLELRPRLASREFQGHSDTETILHCLAERGVQSLAEFNGIFALAFLDVPKKKLFLARDAFGVKPLYYWTDGKSLVFASELRAIRQFSGDELDVGNLAELLRLRYLPSPDTLIQGVFKVRPGHVVEVDLGGEKLACREYPFIGRNREIQPVKTYAEAVRHYGELLEQGVRRQLLSDVQVGIFLSGGIDSALVGSLAQKHAGYRMQAFTVGFSGRPDEDEILNAAETARIIGLDHQHVRIGFPEFLDLLPRITAIVEEPLATASIVPMFYVSSLAAKQVKVVLSGQGADEALGGYGRYRAELINPWIPAAMAPILRKAAKILGVRHSSLLRGIECLGEPDDASRFETIHGVFGREEIGRLIGRRPQKTSERIQYFYDLLECSSQPDGVQRLMSVDLRMNLADDLLLYTDKVSMHHSLECRVPLLDLDLVRFVESLPSRYRVSLRRGKILHKRFAESVLPASVIGRKKNGFTTPTGPWFKTPGPLREILLNKRSRFASYFDLSQVDRVLKEHAAGLSRERQIFLLLTVYYWLAETAATDLNPGRTAVSIPA